MSDNQRNLASCHHTDADFQRVAEVEFASLAHKRTADNLADKTDDNKANSKQQHFSRYAVNRGFKTDTCEENGAEEHI